MKANVFAERQFRGAAWPAIDSRCPHRIKEAAFGGRIAVGNRTPTIFIGCKTTFDPSHSARLASHDDAPAHDEVIVDNTSHIIIVERRHTTRTPLLAFKSRLSSSQST
jgi:hypothetical protein